MTLATAAPQETPIWFRRAKRGGTVSITRREGSIPSLYTVWTTNGENDARRKVLSTTDYAKALKSAKRQLAFRGGSLSN